MVSFHCFRDDDNSKCEWLDGGLRDFADQFNKAFCTNYDLSKCLDRSDSKTKTNDKTRKQPEVLLESPGHQPMVIERKKIVYPRDYYEKHRIFHLFFDCFRVLYEERLEPRLPKAIYEIRTHEKALSNYTKRQLRGLSEQIVEHISSHIETFTASDEICSNSPISWCFGKFQPEPADSFESGLKIHIRINSCFSPSVLAKAEEEIKNELARHLPAIDEKFQDYPSCLKVLILEICGNGSSLPLFDEIVEIVNTSDIPPSIDQIWLAEPQDESGKLITYGRIL